MPDYDDLCKQLRELYVQHGTNYVQAAAEAIESLREQVAAQPPEPDTQKKIVSEMADDYDRMGDPEIAAALRSCLSRAEAAAEAIEAESKAADMIAEERDAWEKRAKALEADNAALRQDAERYRYVRDNIHMGDGENGCDRWSVDLPNTGATLDFEALFDDAVDSAMREGKKE